MDDIENSNIAKFLCRILRAPLGRHVQHLVISARELDAGFFQSFEISEVVSWDPENLSRLKAAVDEASEPSIDAQNWYNAIETGNWDAWVALLLSQLPNLEVLDTNQYGEIINGRTRPWLLSFFKNAALLQKQSPVSPFALPNLKKVSFNQEREEDMIHASEMAAVLCLGSVKTIHAPNLEFCSECEIGWDNERLQFSATELFFSFSNNQDPCFRRLLEHFPMIERFHFDGSPATMSSTDADELKESIVPYKSTLWDFRLAMEDDYNDRSSAQWLLGSLLGFEKLRNITLNAFSLTGRALDPTTLLAYDTVMMKSLPHSLEFLRLYSVTPEEAPSIMTLIRNKTTYTPSLKKLDLQWVTIKYPDDRHHSLADILFKYPGFTIEEACELWEDCKAKGVKMVTTSRCPPTKFVCWKRNVPKILPNGTHLGGYGVIVDLSKTFDYPYNGYKEFIVEQGLVFDRVEESENNDYGTLN